MTAPTRTDAPNAPGTTARAPLAVEHVEVGYGSAPVLRDVSLAVEPGLVTTVIGPNGCGKSTLLRTMAGLLRPARGRVLLDGEPLGDLRLREVARRMTMLPQQPIAPEGLTVADLVARGRQPHQPWYRQWSRDDEEIVATEMAATGVLSLAGRAVDQLSGGQRQRAWIAMALAQRTPVVLLDEPTTHLDLAHAVEVLELVAQLRRESARTIVMVLHDIGLAARYSDRLVVMRDGAFVTAGAPAEVLTSEMLEEVFGLRARVFPDPVDGLPTVTPITRS